MVQGRYLVESEHIFETVSCSESRTLYMPLGCTDTNAIPVLHDNQAAVEWRLASLITFLAGIVIIGLFWPTFSTLIDAWARSRTFAHGFLILPAALYLVWCYRDRLCNVVPTTCPLSLFLLAVLGGGWLVGHVTHTLLVQQVAMIAMIPGLIWVTLGTAVFRAILFPLGFLFFMLPVGTALEPWLQGFTTAFIVVGLELAGIPVHREGYFLTIPSRIWEVAPDCAGLRYVLPGLALGYMFTAVIYRRWLRRFGFLLLCGVLLILANGLRAYGIILTDHLGIADGADHRIFSYTVYGITIPLLFWLGLQWKESGVLETWAPRTSVGQNKAFSVPDTAFAALGAVLLLALAPVAAWLLGRP